MSKRNFYADNYWQTSSFNQRQYELYRQWLFSLAMNRVRWVNLPKTCNARFLEYTLLTQGFATIATPKDNPGMFYSTQAVQQGVPNVYDEPSAWTSYGNNGWNFPVTPQNGVFIYDNSLRIPIASKLETYARRLASIDRTLDLNLYAQHTPYIITGNQAQVQDLIKLSRQIAGGEPAILGTKELNNIVQDINVLDLKVPFIGQDLQAVKGNLMTEIYNFLGIDSMPFKNERMIEDEVTSHNEPTDLRALDVLSTRRTACDKLNERFSKYLDAPIDVVWNQDLESDNYNYQNDITEMLKDA